MILFVNILGYKERINTLICCFVACLLLIQSYKSVDPVSNMLFENYNLVNDKILSVPDGAICDTSVYNRQYTYLDEAIDLAIEKVFEKSEEPVIVFPCKNKEMEGYAWYVGGTWYPERTVYWDIENSARTLEKNDKELKIEYAESALELAELFKTSDEVFYFSFPYLYQDVSWGKEAEISKVEDIEYKGWNIQVYH